MKIALALGSGSARGWAHIGVIRALAEMGVRPDLIAGSSIGSLVGAAYAAGKLEEFEQWVVELELWDVVKLLDVRLEGGLIGGSALIERFSKMVGETTIEELAIPYTAVATNMEDGREVWLQKGRLLDAVRASIALPGLFSPVKHQGRWLIDGGVVNPVPVSVCRAMGAERIIAVNLNGDIVGKHLRKHRQQAQQRGLFEQWLERVDSGWRNRMLEMLGAVNGHHAAETGGPDMFEVLAGSINIMQDRITRSRMAGDPPDVLLSPRLAQLGLLEFDRAAEGIEEGYNCVMRSRDAIEQQLK